MYGYGNSMFLATHGILARTASGGGIDPDAQAFITAASITDPTQQSAINQLVVDLKGYGVWTKMKAIYPFVGGTAAQHKWNLKDPRDLDAAFRLVFNGGWTHSSTGATPNGTNGWADTKLVAQGTLGLNSTHVSVYSRTNVDITAPSIGNVTGGASAEVSMWLRSGGSSFLRVNNPTVSSTVNTDSRGLFIGNRNSSTQINLSIRGTQTTFSQNSNSLLTTVMQLGGVNPNFFDTKQLAFASIGDGLTSQNMTDLTTAVQAFQVTLGRSIGTQTVSDADAQAFVTNAGIVDQVEANAVNNLVIGLKADNLWNNASMIHPYVGGTSTSTSYNLKNTSQFQISWVGGWTWTSQGVKGNGTNSYGNTGFNFSTQITSVNNFTAALYTNQYIAGGVDFGADNNSNWYLAVKSSVFGTNLGAFAAASPVTYADTTGLGFYTAVKSTNPTPGFSNNVIYKNGSSVLSSANTSGTLYNGNVYIGGLNRNGSLLLPTNVRYAFSAIFNSSLTPTEVTNLNNRVTTFQTTLNRL